MNDRCPKCGEGNAFVNQCGCDPNNMPTPVPNKDNRITITIETGSAAFDSYHYGYEIGRILHKAAQQFGMRQNCDDVLHDIKNNVCGSVKIEPMKD